MSRHNEMKFVTMIILHPVIWYTE